MSVAISVIMPARNAATYVGIAAESVASQDVEGIELIVVDDGSTDDTVREAKKAGRECVRVIQGPRKGIAAAVNAGLMVARGQYIARCDADDICMPGRLRRQKEWLEEHPEYAAICGGFGTIDAQGRFIAELECMGATPREVTHELRNAVVQTHLCTFLIRSDGIRMIGGFREFFETAEDIDLQLRLGEYGRVWYDPKACYRYRLHDLSITHAGPDARRTFFEEVARGLQAQRYANGGLDDVDLGRAPEPPARPEPVAVGSANQVNGMLIGRAWRELAAGRRVRAVFTGTRACVARPLELTNWKNLALLALKPAGHNKASAATAALGGGSCA
jgi:glycosyltransferase involved in cell wall biosynthesis